MKLLLVTLLSFTFFIACSAKKEKSVNSYNKSEMKHQIQRAAKADKDLDKELSK
jgi:hypothetical protein